MSDLTAYVIEMLGAELGVRDWAEQEELFRDLGVQIDMWNTEGICEIDIGTLVNFVCETLIPVDGGSLLQAITNDIEWSEVEAFVKQEVVDWFDSKPTDTEFDHQRKKRRLE